MKRWQKILLAVLVLGVVIVAGRSIFSKDETGGGYVFTEVVRTNLSATVSSTGTLSALETVEVGTQVSGQVAQVLVDYNDRVEKGQLLAMIDTEALDAALQNAQAGVNHAQAGYAQAQAQLAEANARLADARTTLNRNAPLAKNGYLSQSEFQPMETAVQTAEASVRSAQASMRSAEAQVQQAQAQVAQARKNRNNAEIRAPISGIIVERSVDAGQTVAASFNTPTLFVLAENLEQMQILTDVDESDIGQIHTGQAVTFNVPAFPDEQYQGIVREVRLQPTTEQNVVTYTVVVDARNKDGHLLPGMTATVDFVTGEQKNALAVSTSAVQLKATKAMLAQLTESPTGPIRPAAAAGTRRVMPTGAQRPAVAGMRPGGATATLWYQDNEGKLHTLQVRTGLNTGALTAIEPVGEAASLIKPGFRVIEQVVNGDENANQQRGPGGPPPM